MTADEFDRLTGAHERVGDRLWAAGTEMPETDALIAATALVHDLVLVTRNVGDFSRSGVRVFDPW